jgi:hypothetical protein
MARNDASGKTHMEAGDMAHRTLCEWHSRVKRAKTFHYKRQHCLETFNILFGILVIILSVASSALAFWALGDGSRWFGYGAAFSGAGAFAFATIQLLSNYKSEALQNYNSAKEYNALQAEIEQAMSVSPTSVTDFMDAYRSKWRSVDKHAPYIPPSYYKDGES